MPIPHVAVVMLTVVALLSFREQPRHPEPAAGRPPATASTLPDIVPNDNRTPAGSLNDGLLSLDLRAAEGVWRPRAESGAPIEIAAFGESAATLTIPAPLIRVSAGATVSVSVRNELDSPMRVHGLCERGSSGCAPLDVPSGEMRHVQFNAGAPGTYHYWATTTGMPQQFRGANDTQLSGAFVVDAPEAQTSDDRIFVITEWTSLTTPQLFDIAKQDDPGEAFLKVRPDVLFLINGRAWPHTERLQYDLGARIRWRIVNLSTQIHPMHLHGFYFAVESMGDGVRDKLFEREQRPNVVTQLMQPASTMLMSWTPKRVGNWLFHCHVMTHVSPTLRVDGTTRAADAHGHDQHGAAGMTGMVLGITVTGDDEAARASAATPVRKLSLLMQGAPDAEGDATAMAFAPVPEQPTSEPARATVPGPTLVLTRGEPVEITLTNHLREATAIHWHGMELDSYYDGVHGWSGFGQQVTPLIPPGGSFVVRFTPPRTGTFMYHTHLHEKRQLTSGLYGAMLVVDPGETFDESTDHVVVLGRGAPEPDAPVVVNNQRTPRLTWKAGVRHRIRVINITPDDILSVSLQSQDKPVAWMPLTKDGAPVPSDRQQPGVAQQIIGVGETFDFAYDAPPGRRNLWLEVRSPGGRWQAQGQIIVK
jgi:FtsP/CotA-like multicopper oxidase with cupredoxin domain